MPTRIPAPAAAPARGRPRTITPQRIISAGMDMTLPELTMKGVAQRLGVTQIALYKHVSGLEALRLMVADAIFAQWSPPPFAGKQADLPSYLLAFSDSLRTLVATHPGVVPFLVRRQAKSPEMIRRIQAHHQTVSKHFGLPPQQARWLLSTVAFHCVALADTVYSAHAADGDTQPLDSKDGTAWEAEFRLSMRALIAGAVEMCRAGRLPVLP